MMIFPGYQALRSDQRSQRWGPQQNTPRTSPGKNTVLLEGTFVLNIQGRLEFDLTLFLSLGIEGRGEAGTQGVQEPPCNEHGYEGLGCLAHPRQQRAIAS